MNANLLGCGGLWGLLRIGGERDPDDSPWGAL